MLETITEVWLLLFMGMWLQLSIAAGIFIAFIVFRKLFARYIFKVILKFTLKTKTDLDTKLLLAFERPLQVFFVILGIFIALSYLPLDAGMNALLAKFFRSAVVAILAAGIYNLFDNESFLFDELREKFNFEFDKILVPFLSKVIRVLIIVLAITMVAETWDFEVGAFVTGLGLGGLAFALAAKDTASNLFGGIVIITDKPFSIGDWIYTSSVEGTVEDISFRSTKVRTFAQALVTVPNATLANQPITNWTRMGRRQITFNLGVTYTTPRVKLKKCVENIRQMLENHPDIHPQTIFARFDKFSDSSLDIFLYFFTKTVDWGEYLAVREDVNLKIMEILETEGVSVAFPSRSIYFETPLEEKSQKQETVEPGEEKGT